MNGEAHRSGTGTLAVPNAGIITLGNRTGSSNYFTGTLDEVRFHDLVMTADEIEKLYRAASRKLLGWTETDPNP